MMGRRSGDVFVIGEESLLGGREDEPLVDRPGDREEGDWAPFDEEEPTVELRRSPQGRSVWLRRAVLTLAALIVGAAVASRAIVSGTSAIASGTSHHESEVPLVLGPSREKGSRGSGASRGRTAPRGQRRSVRHRRRPASVRGAGHADGGPAPSHHGGGPVSYQSPRTDSKEAEAGAVEEREPPVEEAPTSAPVEAPPVETVVAEPASEPPVEAPPPAEPQPEASSGGGSPEGDAGRSGADEFGFER